MNESLQTTLRKLRLSGLAQSLEVRLHEATSHSLDHAEFLELILQDELAVRDDRRMNRRITAAAFRDARTLEDFDFAFQPKLDVKMIKDLASCDFVERKENVILVGQPGTGKTHLGLALGLKACERGLTVRFTTVQDLAASLRAAEADRSVEQRIGELIEPDLVILDELGFTPLEPAVADAFYRIIASRYERKSLIVTSNKSFESWAEVFPDAVIASAVLDRLVHHAHLVPIVGESYRMRGHKTRGKEGAAAAA